MNSSQLGILGFLTMGLGVAGWVKSPFGCGESFYWSSRKRFGSSWLCDLNYIPLPSQMLWAQSGDCRRLLWPDPLGPDRDRPTTGFLRICSAGVCQVSRVWLPGCRPLLMFLEALSQRARWLGWDGSVPYQPGWHGCALCPVRCVCGCCS